MRLAAAKAPFTKWVNWVKVLVGATPLLVAVYGHAQCFGIDYYWTNSLGGNWNNAANWFPNGVPGGNACDTATIGFPGTYTVVLNSSNVTIYALTIGFMSGTHTLVITNPGSLTVTGGAFVDTNGILDLSGGVLDQGTNSVVAGVFNWAGGTLGGAGPVTVVTNGLLQILTASSNLLGTTVLNYGTTTWTNSTANLYFSRQLPAAAFVNEPGGVFENRNGPAMAFAGGLTTPPASAGFYNNGLFRKVGGNGTSTRIQVPFSNGGTILPLRGNLAFNNILTLAASSVLQFPISGIQPGTNFGTITVAPASSVLAALGMPGSVQWAGTLIVGPTNGFQPALGNTFSLMTFGMKESGFDTGFLAGLTNNLFIQMQVPSDRQSLVAVIQTSNAPSLLSFTNIPDQTVAVGNPAVFSAPTFGVVPDTYQWQYTGTNLVGETNANLNITNAQPGNTGSYCVTVTDALQESNTWCASLSVVPLQGFTFQPSDRTVSNGVTVILSAGVTNSLPVQFQWRRNGVNISGATSSTFTLTTNAQPWNGGSYDVLVASAVGVLDSSDAVVTVTSPALSFSNFPGGILTVFTNGSTTFSGSGNNVNSTNVPGEPDIEGNPPAHRLWLQWTTPFSLTNGTVELDLAGSAFDTLLAVYTDSTPGNVTNLTLLVDNDDSLGNLSRVHFPVQANTTYYIAVDGFDGEAGNVVLNGVLNPGLVSTPEFNYNNQPRDQSVLAGGTATFSTSISNVNYQWLKSDWLKIPGATGPTLSISNAGPGDVDTYTVTAWTGTNGQAVDSVRATLEIGPSLSFRKPGLLIRAYTQAGGNLFRVVRLSASVAGFPSVAAGSIDSQLINNFNSLTAQNEPTTNGIGGSPRWYLLSAATNATLEIDTEGSNIRTSMVAYTNFLNSPFWSIVASDVNSAPDGQSQMRFLAVSNAPYLIEVDGNNGAQGNNVYVNWRMGIPPNTAGAPEVLALLSGAPLLLSAGVNGNVTGPVTCQWQLNGTNIPGAALSYYQLDGIQFNQCGSYSVIVSNLLGVVTNAIALVTVDSTLKLARDASTQPASMRLSGSAPQATVLLLNTNLASSVWSPLSTNPTPLLPIIYLDTNSSSRDTGFYRLKSWP